MDRSNTLSEWRSYEAKAASISHERRAEEMQLEQLKIRLHNIMRAAEQHEQQVQSAA